MIIDLTLPLRDGMSVYPGDPPVSIEPALTIAGGDGVNVSQLRLGSHSGTHIDAPFHIADAGAGLADVLIERLIGRPRVIDVSGVGDGEPITATDMAAELASLGRGDIVLLSTGWPERRTDGGSGAHPWLRADAAEAIAGSAAAALGIDTPSVDRAPSDPSETRLDAHAVLLGAGTPIIENLVRLHRIAELRDPLVAILPLALDGDGAPVRAVAFDRAIGTSAGSGAIGSWPLA